jgi:hypothetical protein
VIFFNYIKITNHKRWESKKTKQLEKGKNKVHNICHLLYFVLFRTTFLSSKAMRVAIDCRSKNWVVVRKRLRSAGVDYRNVPIS